MFSFFLISAVFRVLSSPVWSISVGVIRPCTTSTSKHSIISRPWLKRGLFFQKHKALEQIDTQQNPQNKTVSMETACQTLLNSFYPLRTLCFREEFLGTWSSKRKVEPLLAGGAVAGAGDSSVVHDLTVRSAREGSFCYMIVAKMNYLEPTVDVSGMLYLGDLIQ